MLAIEMIFVIVVTGSLLPILNGFDSLINYKLFNSALSDRKKRTIYIINFILYSICVLSITSGVYILSKFLASFKLGNYISVFIYTLLLALLSTNSIYQSPKIEINSAIAAFKNGFTRANVTNILAHLPLKALLNLLYLIILILAQIEDLEFCKFPESVSYFFTLNKYGIVIMLSTEKIIKSFNTDKERAKVLTEAFLEKEKEDDALRKEIKQSFKELKESLKNRRLERKQEKEQRKKDKNK